jgi:hypothetical protein
MPRKLSNKAKVRAYDELIAAVRALAQDASVCQLKTDWVRAGAIVIQDRALYDAVEAFAYPAA